MRQNKWFLAVKISIMFDDCCHHFFLQNQASFTIQISHQVKDNQSNINFVHFIKYIQVAQQNALQLSPYTDYNQKYQSSLKMQPLMNQRTIMYSVWILIALTFLIMYRLTPVNRDCPEYHQYNEEKQACTLKQSIADEIEQVTTHKIQQLGHHYENIRKKGHVQQILILYSKPLFQFIRNETERKFYQEQVNKFLSDEKNQFKLRFRYSENLIFPDLGRSNLSLSILKFIGKVIGMIVLGLFFLVKWMVIGLVDIWLFIARGYQIYLQGIFGWIIAVFIYLASIYLEFWGIVYLTRWLERKYDGLSFLRRSERIRSLKDKKHK